ncbi:hypothetical protein ACJZ2D_013304 [Fusarium nematophilum]
MLPTPTGLFVLLPNELILYLAALLPITDVLSLKLAAHGLLLVLERRIEPSEYIQSTGPFTNSRELLEAMAMHGAVLSGSRALEYFVPGSATDESDWDFYVPPVLSSVTAVKSALERSGVTFESSLARAERELREESSTTLNRNQIISIAYEASFNARAWSPEERIIIDTVRSTYPYLRDMTPHVRMDGSVRWMEGLNPMTIRDCGSVSLLKTWRARRGLYPDSIAAKVLSGKARKNNKTVHVQLVIGTIDPRKISFAEPLLQTVFQSIFSFYGSHVQCILTKHAALHMYYSLAVKKNAYRWHVPVAIQRKAEAAVQKYVSRGFEFKAAAEDDRWIFRSAQDDDSCFIELDTGDGYSPSLSQIKGLRWHHTREAIRPSLQSETMDARHELLNFGIFSRQAVSGAHAQLF